MKRSKNSGARASVNMRHLYSGMLLLLLMPNIANAYDESRMENRGYSSVPYDARDDQDDKQEEEGRMSGRGYNSNPYEVNVDGIDNLFSREGGCSPDSSGLFGTDEGNEQDLGFYYQIETIPILERSEEARGEILDQVETSVSKTLLPSLFLKDCAVTERSRQVPHRRLEEMLGITTLPVDTVLEGGMQRRIFIHQMQFRSLCFLPAHTHFFSFFQWNVKENFPIH